MNKFSIMFLSVIKKESAKHFVNNDNLITSTIRMDYDNPLLKNNAILFQVLE